MNPHLGGLVLAGGLGSRMGYVNKGLQPWFTDTLITPAVGLLRQHCAHVAISANQDLAHYQTLGVEVWSDAPQWQGCGPLAGVVSSVVHFPGFIDSVQILPCDTPFLNADVIMTLSKALESGTTTAVYAQTEHQIHPVVCQFKYQALASLLEYLNTTGKHSIRRWLQQIAAQPVWFEDESQFANINDVATLNRLQTQAIRKDHSGFNVL